MLNLTAGMSIKKLNMIEKKNKKSLKVTNIMIRSVIRDLRNIGIDNKLLIQFKGTKFDINKHLELLNKHILKYKEIYIIYTPIITNKYIYKKVRSLKKNFRKNYLK